MKKLLLLLPFLLFASEIKDVKFQNLKHISIMSAKDISLVHKGDEFDLDKVDKSIVKFYKFGYFSDIKADWTNHILTYIFTQKPAILEIKFNHASNDLKELLKNKIKKGMILSQNKLDQLKDFIITYYDAKGEFNTVVTFDTKHVNANGVILTININKGTDIIIDKLKFYGVKKESFSDIRDEISNKDKDFLGWLPFRSNGELNLRTLINDASKIQDFYLSKGYLDVNVSKPLVVANFDNYKAQISYKIDEGRRYKVGEVNIKIPQGIADINKLKENLLLLKGLYFNIKRLRKDIKYLSTQIANKGYAYVQVYPQIQKHANIANVTYVIIPHQKVYISDVLIEGNTKTLDRVIRRSVYLTPGYLYSYTDKEDTIKALKRTGYFDDVKLKEIRVDDTHIKILIKVKEGLTGSLRAGISYNSYSKIGLTFSTSEKNIFGSGQSLSASIETSSVSSLYSLSLRNPRILDSQYSFTAKVYNKTFDSYSYDSHRKGFALTLGRELSRHVAASVTYGLERLTLSDVTTEDLVDDRLDSLKSYIAPAISYNSTDDYFFAQHGILASLTAEYAGIGGDQKFIKTVGKFKYFYSLEDKYDILTILKYKIKGGYIDELGYLPLSEKFYLGGNGSVRGFEYGSISPVDENGEEIGGKVMVVNSFEISMPISQKRKMWVSGFVDYGAVGETSLNIDRSSYGVSIDWITPMGPLNFTWAKPIKTKEGDKLRGFEFSIGSSF
ncbi:MAG: outer membrane protein assembly factor BamA [Epsilonproteobacteria bacterium]|nr:outer membrane protein assembly factor BamA [Campylobacterota bacterium]